MSKHACLSPLYDTDHTLVCCKVKLRNFTKQGLISKIDTNKISKAECVQQFKLYIDEKAKSSLAVNYASWKWDELCNIIHSTVPRITIALL